MEFDSSFLPVLITTLAAFFSSIVTAISPAPAFWPAEEYHQQFLEKGGQDASKGSAEAIKCYG